MTIRATLFILTGGLLFSCSSNDRERTSSVKTSDVFTAVDTKVSLAGFWLSEKYFNNINKFKSPKKAQDGSEFIVIPNTTLKQTMIIYNFHEGGPFLKILKKQYKYEIWEIRSDSSIQKSYTIGVISPQEIQLGDTKFVKINLSETKNGYLILEEILFKGNYTNAKGENIEIKNNGQIIGLDQFHFYQPIIDYYDEGMQVDQIRLGNSKKDNTYFGFKFNSDTLEIFKLNCLVLDSTSNNCGEVKLGQLVYKLWKKK